MKIAPYGSWKSPITSDLIVAQSVGLSEIRLDNGGIHWAESRPHEAGRSVIVSGAADGVRDLIPRPFSARSRVHEYGGGAWTMAEGTLYFSNDSDQRLYRLDPGAADPAPITGEGAFRYADGVIDSRRRCWIGVREDHTEVGHEAANAIVRIRLDGAPLDCGRVLSCGHDFYSSPRLSPDGRQLAYLAWDHPRMPWVGTTLYAVPLDADGAAAGSPKAIAGGETESVFQPEWAPDGSALFFISDRSGWWNLYRRRLELPESESIAPMQAEFGQPQWVFGMSTYDFAGDGRLVCSYVSQGLGRLATIDLESGKFTPIDLPYTDFSSVRAEGDRVVFRAGSAITPASFVLLDQALEEARL